MSYTTTERNLHIRKPTLRILCLLFLYQLMWTHSRCPALWETLQRPLGWCKPWPRRTHAQCGMGEPQDLCTHLQRCNWMRWQKDRFLWKKNDPSYHSLVIQRIQLLKIMLYVLREIRIILVRSLKRTQSLPKSISKRAALAPSTRIFLLGPVRALYMKYTPSVTRGRNFSA